MSGLLLAEIVLGGSHVVFSGCLPLAQSLPGLAYVFQKHGVIRRKFTGLSVGTQGGLQLACAGVGQPQSGERTDVVREHCQCTLIGQNSLVPIPVPGGIGPGPHRFFEDFAFSWHSR